MGAFLFVGVYCVIFSMKTIWYIIYKFNARFRKPFCLPCCYVNILNYKVFIVYID